MLPISKYSVLWYYVHNFASLREDRIFSIFSKLLLDLKNTTIRKALAWETFLIHIKKNVLSVDFMLLRNNAWQTIEMKIIWVRYIVSLFYKHVVILLLQFYHSYSILLRFFQCYNLESMVDSIYLDYTKTFKIVKFHYMSIFIP